MNINRTKVKGVKIITPDVYEDDRGYFKETCNPHTNFMPVQGNQSISKKGVIRGLHYQPGAAKLVWVAKGSVYDMVLDPETGEQCAVILSDNNHRQIYVPPGYAHGFQAMEDDTVVCYLMDDYYNPDTEGGYNPEPFDWPIRERIISDKDKNAPKFRS